MTGALIGGFKRWAAYRVGRSNDQLRHDFVRDELARVPAGARLLDAGAGERRFQNYCAHLRYVSQDFGRYDGVGDRAGLQTGTWDQSGIDLVCDITAIPEPDRSFDAILCTEVFEHIPDPLAAVREFARLLKPGGTLILTAPFASWTHFAPYHFYSGFNRYFYETHLPRLGFEIERLATNGNYFEFLAQELWRLDEVATRYAGKRIGLIERLASIVVLNALARLSRRDRGSDALLCYGLGVRAVRRADAVPGSGEPGR